MNDQLTAIAVNKAVKTTEAREASAGLTEGTYEVDVLVRIKGVIKRGADYVQRIVGKAKPWLLVFKYKEELEKVYELIERARANGDDGEGLKALFGHKHLSFEEIIAMAETVDPTLAKQAEKEANAEVAKIKAPTETPCNGKITTDLLVEVVEEVIS